MMMQSKDPFEAAFVELEDSPPESPITVHEIEAQLDDAYINDMNQPQDEVMDVINHSNIASTSAAPIVTTGTTQPNKIKDEEEDEEEENMDVELGKFPSGGNPDKAVKIQAILSQFTEEQMNRFESYRRSSFQKSNMKRLLVSITGSQKISMPMTIVVSGIAKVFVGELVETARIVMAERKDYGPIRPCHIREAFRRLKLQGKVPRRTVSRLFR